MARVDQMTRTIITAHPELTPDKARVMAEKAVAGQGVGGGAMSDPLGIR